MMNIIDLIQGKRDGQEHTRDEIRSLIDGYMSGAVADYQMSAWLMAAFFKGLTFDETLALTDALIASGETLDLSSVNRRVVDKHSTGGVGDKVSLVLGPLVASCGAVFGKMSGRCLGHTGGTVDKLESIPGFRTEISVRHFIDQLKETGVCIASQTLNLVPADKRLYSLRDVTATIDSNSLTAASIMSKKLAGGASAVVLDIKVGRGAFFRTLGHASGVAHLMKKIGEVRGIEIVPVMTSMEQPLGNAVGNALEVMEAVETLKGNGPEDLVEVVVALAAPLLKLSDLGWSQDTSESEARRRLSEGLALDKFREWIEAQGGDCGFIEDSSLLPAAKIQLPVTAPADGFVSGIDALQVGKAVLAMGGGRLKRDSEIDHSVGVVLNAKTGDPVKKNQALATVHAADNGAAIQACAAIADAYSVGVEQAEPIAPVIA